MMTKKMGQKESGPYASQSAAGALVPSSGSFVSWVAETYPGPDAVMAALLDHAATAAAEVGAVLESVPNLDDVWYDLPSAENGKSDKRQSYRGRWFTCRNGLILPAITFHTFRHGGKSVWWMPRDVLWRAYEQRKRAGARSQAPSAEYAVRAADLRQTAIANAAQRAAHETAAKARKLKKLQDDWDNGDLAPAAHAYIERKHGQVEGMRVVCWPLDGWGAFYSTNLLGWLMVPAYSSVGNAGGLMSVQFIGPNRGEKLNACVPIKGGSFTVGELRPGDVAYVVEGVAHAWTLNAVTYRAAVVCFGAGNLEVIAEAVMAAGAVAVIVPDRGMEVKAARIAERLGCRYAPLPADLPHGHDVNDLFIQRGAAAVLEVVA
ncbi:toprim domain-containing protein [Xenophilus aerolatus]|nr:toprim domain-containing protein [Xenophilus aerolatus]